MENLYTETVANATMQKMHFPARLSEDAVYSLIEFESDEFFIVADRIGWHLRQQYGGPDGAGRDMFGTLFAASGGKRLHPEGHCDRLWSSFDRPRKDSDQLLLDVAEDAIGFGWEAPDEVVAEIERLQCDPDEDELLAAFDARQREQIAMRDAAQAEWAAFGGAATREQIDVFSSKYAKLHIMTEFQPVTIIPFPAAAAPMPDLIVSAADFVNGFVPPEYLIDGMLQRRYLYSLTAGTGVGKTAIGMRWAAHVISGMKLDAADVEKGAVLYMAGENPTDVQARWLGLSMVMGLDPESADMHFLVGAMNIAEVAGRIVAEVAAKKLSLALVIVDTAAAYNFGDDENNNAQMGAYARQLRTLTSLPGGPCVVVLCHPTKRAGNDDLMPRGGGAFIAEVDGNLAVIKDAGFLTVCPQIKFRGAQDWKSKYELSVIRDHPVLKDAKGKAIPTVVARPVSDGAAEILEKRTDADMERLLDTVHHNPSTTPTDLARLLGWTFGAKADPNINRVKRNLERLAKDKLVRETMGKWRATEAGQRELNAIDTARANRPLPPMPSGVHFPGPSLTD